jgi:hypothetical protein
MEGSLVISETFDGSRGGPDKENHQDQGRQERTGSDPELAASLPLLLHLTLTPEVLQITFPT